MKKHLLVPALLLMPTFGFTQEIKKEYVNPTPGYTNVVAVTIGNVKTLYIAGQVGSPDTILEQLKTSFQSLLAQIEAGGASFSDVVRMTIYIVDYRQEDLPLVSQARREVFGEGRMPAITMLGVSSLAFDKMKVETEAVAVVQVN